MRLFSLPSNPKKPWPTLRTWRLSTLLVPLLLLVPLQASAAVPVVAGFVGFLSSLGAQLFGAAADAGASLVVVAVSVGIVSYIAFSLAKFLLWVAAMLFNWSMETMVFGFSTIFGNSEGMLLAWSLLRDLGNIVLLFGFIWIGIQMILNVGHHSASKALPRLIIFAVLINFSLFAAQAIIDVSNGLTYGFYTQSTDTSTCDGVGDSQETECALNNGIAGQILAQLNIISVMSGASGFNVDLASDAATYFSNPVGGTITFVSLAMLVAVAAVVLFAGAFLLVTRGITLCFLMIISPIGFAGMAIPALHDMAEKWWSALIKNAFFAPVFLILLFVGLRLSDGLEKAMKIEGGLGDALLGGAGLGAGPIFLFVLVIAFLIAALMIAKKFSIMGADFAINSASALTLGTMARGTNLAGGMMALNARRFIESSDMLSKRKGLQVLTNRFLRPLENANLDLRRAGVGSALKMGGVGSGAEVAEHATLGDLRHMYDDAKEGKEGKKLEKQFMDEIATRKLEENIHNGTLTDDNKKKLLGMSTEKIAEMHATKEIDPTRPGDQAFTAAFSPQQFDDLMKSDKLDDAEKGAFRTARFNAVLSSAATLDADKFAEHIKGSGFVEKQKDALRQQRFVAVEQAPDSDTARTEMKGMLKEDFEMMPKAVLMKESTLAGLTEVQRSFIENSPKFTRDQKQAVKDHTEAKLFERDLTSARTAAQVASIVARIPTMDLKQVGELSATILQRPDVAGQFNKAMLTKIQSGGTLKTKQSIQDVANAIRRNNPAMAAHISDPQSPAHEFWN